MRKFIIAFLAMLFIAGSAFSQQNPPTLRIVTESPNLPSELYYGNIHVKPLRLRPGTNIPITIDDADFFVHMHYVDFLSRFPDQAGFNFWVADITNCNQMTDPTARAGCIDYKRTNVSAAYFLSPEFQDTGYFVYRMYRAALPASSARPRGYPRYSEFMTDTRQVGNGVIGNAPGWEALIESNKQAYTQAFVARSEFVALYPTALTAAQYVDALYTTAALTPSAAQRQAAITAFGGGGVAGRAAALRAVVDNQTLKDREFRPAFVLMQYFGYLRRSPDDAPNTDFSGFDFWLNKLNEHSGDYIGAEMVRSFLVSSEYRDRF
jgi:hypothetical protein